MNTKYERKKSPSTRGIVVARSTNNRRSKQANERVKETLTVRCLRLVRTLMFRNYIQCTNYRLLRVGDYVLELYIYVENIIQMIKLPTHNYVLINILNVYIYRELCIYLQDTITYQK